MKKDVEILTSMLEKVMSSTPATPDTSKTSDKPKNSSNDSGIGNKEESKGETEKE